jgi:uncharacterized SAM-binding protein YcdF (DUF218 family)
MIGFLLSFRSHRAGRRLMAAAVLALYICSTPFCAALFSRTIQLYPALSEAAPEHERAGAIVVLAGGVRPFSPEYDGDDMALRTVGRVRYAARLAKRTALPLLVSGGTTQPDNDMALSEGRMMQRLLRTEFAVDNVIWIEDTSLTTRENAINSSRLLRAHRIDTVLLVTHAAHMARALAAFRRNGIEAIAAPTLFFNEKLAPLELRAWLPALSAMSDTRYVLHEWLGRIWYWWRDGGTL